MRFQRRAFPSKTQMITGWAIATGLSWASTSLAQTGTPDLTGTYRADDGGIYYMQQAGNILVWAGMSLDSGLPADNVWHRGLDFTNVFRGTINGDGSLRVRVTPLELRRFGNA